MNHCNLLPLDDDHACIMCLSPTLNMSTCMHLHIYKAKSHKRIYITLCIYNKDDRILLMHQQSLNPNSTKWSETKKCSSPIYTK